jgi:hypothetical protein
LTPFNQDNIAQGSTIVTDGPVFRAYDSQKINSIDNEAIVF